MAPTLNHSSDSSNSANNPSGQQPPRVFEAGEPSAINEGLASMSIEEGSHNSPSSPIVATNTDVNASWIQGINDQSANIRGSITVFAGRGSITFSQVRRSQPPASTTAPYRRPAPAHRPAWRCDCMTPFNEQIRPPYYPGLPPPNGMVLPPPPIVYPVPLLINPDPYTQFSPFDQGVVLPAPGFPYGPYGTCYQAIQQQNFHREMDGTKHSYSRNFLKDVRRRLRAQIEYYFSNENLETDYYLKKHMDDQGWVPISLIAGFRRVKSLMEEEQIIHETYRPSNSIQVQINEPPISRGHQFILDSLRSSYEVEVKGDRVRKRREWVKWVTPQSLTKQGTDQPPD